MGHFETRSLIFSSYVDLFYSLDNRFFLEKAGSCKVSSHYHYYSAALSRTKSWWEGILHCPLSSTISDLLSFQQEVVDVLWLPRNHLYNMQHFRTRGPPVLPQLLWSYYITYRLIYLLSSVGFLVCSCHLAHKSIHLWTFSGVYAAVMLPNRLVCIL